MQHQFKKIETLDELIAEAEIPTETKQTQAQQQPVVTEPAPPPPPIIEDLEEEDVEEPMTPKKLKSNTDFVLGMINVAQQSTFKFGANYNYKKKLTRLYGDDALLRAEIVGDLDAESLSESDKGILKLNLKMQKLFESLPMTADEKELLYPVVEEWVVANQGKIPKNFYTYLGIAQMVGGRLINVLSI